MCKESPRISVSQIWVMISWGTFVDRRNSLPAKFRTDPFFRQAFMLVRFHLLKILWLDPLPVLISKARIILGFICYISRSTIFICMIWIPVILSAAHLDKRAALWRVKILDPIIILIPLRGVLLNFEANFPKLFWKCFKPGIIWELCGLQAYCLCFLCQVWIYWHFLRHRGLKHFVVSNTVWGFLMRL